MASGIIMATIIVGVVGCAIGFLLCLASEKFKVEVDPREEQILGVLPGNNCGGCAQAAHMLLHLVRHLLTSALSVELL